MCSDIYPFCLHTWETPFKSVYGSERNKSSKKVTRWGVYRTICHDNCTIYRKPIVKLYHQSKHIVNEQTIHVKIDIHLVYTSFSFVSHEIKKSIKKFYSLYIVNLTSIFTKKNACFHFTWCVVLDTFFSTYIFGECIVYFTFNIPLWVFNIFQ